MTSVFVSYTHDSDAHKQVVLDFATFLIDCGIDAVLDEWVWERQDWGAWAIRHLTECDYVIVVASEGYRRMGDGTGPNDRNLGGQWEAAMLRDSLQEDRATWSKRILPVVLPGQSKDGIPRFLQPHAASHYNVDSLSPEGAEGLLRTITKQPRHIRPPLGEPIVLPPLSGPGAPTGASAGGPVWTPLPSPLPVVWRGELFHERPHSQPTVELHLIPAEATRFGVGQLETVRDQLPDLGRSRKVFSSTEALIVDSTDQLAWTRSGNPHAGGRGIVVHRNGQRTCWFPVPPATLGSIFDRDDQAVQLSNRLDLLLEVPLPLPTAFAPAIGLAPTDMVRLGRLSEAPATQAIFPIGRAAEIRFDADETVTITDLRRFTRDVAEELVARVASVLRQ
ncbi:SEFIR domain-containing protein [Amycolatopsis suaedae]|uniref:SEFIR domain-containing protein n=1 Tax=Amycolatopsis suaedae TaxID=2510978 RepID=UPI0013EF0EB4|nr:SEFIR domain-containing protein [Amycolatopsis suaedae]